MPETAEGMEPRNLLKKAELKVETEAMLFAAQEQFQEHFKQT